MRPRIALLTAFLLVVSLTVPGLASAAARPEAPAARSFAWIEDFLSRIGARWHRLFQTPPSTPSKPSVLSAADDCGAGIDPTGRCKP
jgi:hypothetical protein